MIMSRDCKTSGGGVSGESGPRRPCEDEKEEKEEAREGTNRVNTDLDFGRGAWMLGSEEDVECERFGIVVEEEDAEFGSRGNGGRLSSGSMVGDMTISESMGERTEMSSGG